MKIALTGGTGLIGRALASELLAQHRLLILSRRPQDQKHPLPVQGVPWDSLSGLPPAQELEGADAVIHLAGTPLAGGLWTARRKQLIWDSRVKGTRHLVDALAHCRRRPQVLLSASGVGFYGDGGDRMLTEESESGGLFLGDLAREWESRALAARQLGMRVVLLRTGLVLTRQGGLLARLLPVFRFGLGGPVGSGRQWMSWIHLQDEVRAIRHCLENPEIEGPVNLTAPHPVTNREFVRTLAQVLRRPALLRLPAFAVKLFLGQMGRELLLAGQRAVPQRLLNSGFRFHFQELKPALEDISGKR